ncbi:hypothetical protein AB0N65_11905 [Paenarthrobacter sp. NPDC089322]|uniref:hypothetical protein n=1 Tax=Paenarthrobacter sp. NPDC089322 TaxID=3155065 RepID=UPI00341DAA46
MSEQSINNLVAAIAAAIAVLSLIASWVRAGAANRTAAASSITAKDALAESKRANRTAEDANKIAQRLHDESGGRVTVRMNAAAYQPRRADGGLHTQGSGEFYLEEIEAACVELCQIVVENPGRTGVTVTDVRLRFEGLPHRYAATTPCLTLDSTFHGQSSIPDRCFRLEPYDRKTLLMDYWSVVDSLFTKNPSLAEVSIHAEVEVAGHGNVFHSKAHGNWTIQRRMVSAYGDHFIRRPRNVILTSMMRTYFQKLSHLNGLGEYAATAEQMIDPSWNFEAIKDRLELVKTHPKAGLFALEDRNFDTDGLALALWSHHEALGEQIRPFPVPEVVKQGHQEWVACQDQPQEGS